MTSEELLASLSDSEQMRLDAAMKRLGMPQERKHELVDAMLHKGTVGESTAKIYLFRKQ